MLLLLLLLLLLLPACTGAAALSLAACLAAPAGRSLLPTTLQK
jgi:hypothetical protein